MSGNQALAGLVATRIEKVLKRVKVDPAVLREMIGLKDMAVGNKDRANEGSCEVTSSSFHYSLNCPANSVFASPSNVPFSPSLETTNRDLHTPKEPLKLISKAGKHPSIDDMRTLLLRGMQRTICWFSTRKHCPWGLLNHKTPILAVENLRNLYETHKSMLEDMGNCPYRYRLSTESKAVSDAFCQQLLSSEAFHSYYLCYLKVVFGAMDCKVVCRTLKAKCCLERVHTQECAKVWTLVYEFAKRKLLEPQGMNQPSK